MSTQPNPQLFQGIPSPFASAEKMNAGAFFLSKSLHLSLYNDMAGRLLNTTSPIGQPMPLASCLSVQSEEYQVLQQMIASGKEYRDVIVNWESDGRTRHVLIDSFSQTDEHGRLLGMYVLMKDLGNFSVLEQQMQRSDKLATVGKVAAGVAHEIRNPLTSIKGFLQMFEHRFTDEHRESELAYTKVMLQDLQRVESLIAELLFLSKPNQLDKSDCAIEGILGEIREEVALNASRQGINTQFSVRSLPRIFADGRLLKQAIEKIVENAMQAMDGGGTLRIHAYATSNWIKIDVSDSGPGIPYYLMDKIFDTFFTTKENGTGLGLPICQRILADHGGEIRVSSKGFGTTFSLLLPV